MTVFNNSLYILLHPAGLVLWQILLTAVAIGITSPSSRVRIALLPLQALLLWLVYERCLRVIPFMSVATVMAGNAPTYFLRYLDVAVLNRWNYETSGPTTSLCARNSN